MNETFEYVMSGCSFARLNFRECSDDLELRQWLIDAGRSLQGKDNHSFGILANALTEVHLCKTIHANEKYGAVRQYADSGGLQIITQGLDAGEDTKKKVYQTQAKYSDIAMCFDEIPLEMSGTSSKRLDRTGRWFSASTMEAKARETGRNVHNQINLFLDEKSDAKPIVIVQGNCFETYQRWCQYVMEEIPQEKHKYIGGVAIGTGAFGHGDLEEITKAFIFSSLPIYEATHHLHLLGIGSVVRLMPYIISIQTGHFKEDLLISYDSTTHSSGLHFGRFYIDGGDIDVPTHFDKTIYSRVYEEISSKFDMAGIDLEKFYDGSRMPSLKFQEKYGTRNDLIRSNVAWILTSIRNFMAEVNAMQDKKKLLAKLDKKKQNIYNSLYGVKTLDDFKHWEKHVGRFVESKRIGTQQAANLTDFLG